MSGDTESANVALKHNLLEYSELLLCWLVKLMGQTRGYCTIMTHLRWTPVIMLGYTASVATYLWLNANLF
jgi:hypothetical protein